MLRKGVTTTGWGDFGGLSQVSGSLSHSLAVSAGPSEAILCPTAPCGVACGQSGPQLSEPYQVTGMGPPVYTGKRGSEK